MTLQSARAIAVASVGAVRDDPGGRLALMRSQYRVPPDVDCGYLPFRQAASAFMRWQLRRGLLNPIDSPKPGSPWRAINERLLYDGSEARALAFGHPGPPSSPHGRRVAGVHSRSQRRELVPGAQHERRRRLPRE